MKRENEVRRIAGDGQVVDRGYGCRRVMGDDGGRGWVSGILLRGSEGTDLLNCSS